MSLAVRRDPSVPDGENPTISTPVSADGTPVPGLRYQVPARQGRAVRLRKGQRIIIENTHGTQVCDFWAFDAADIGLFLSLEHTRANLSRVIPRAGDVLMDNRRDPLLDFVFDSSPGIHDTLCAACDHPRYVKLGAANYHDNCADNLRMALLAIGLKAPEIPAPFNLWMNTPADTFGRIHWLPPVSKAGDTCVFRALRDVIVVMSACPQDMLPINDLHPVEVHFTVEA
jgi:uncharacterized protein YcgI (DUF1989 family)